jgi:hypothetical protein
VLPHAAAARYGRRFGFLVAEHETFAGIRRKWNFVPQHGIQTAG